MQHARSVLVSVIGIQEDLADLAHQRIPGICAGALIVEGLLYHIIQPCQEVLLVDAVVPDGLLNTHPCLQLFHRLNELFQLLLVSLTAQVQVIRNLGIALQGMGMIVLREA